MKLARATAQILSAEKKYCLFGAQTKRLLPRPKFCVNQHWLLVAFWKNLTSHVERKSFVAISGLNIFRIASATIHQAARAVAQDIGLKLFHFFVATPAYLT